MKKHKDKINFSPIREQIIKKRALKDKLKKRMKVLFAAGDMNLYNAAQSALESVLSDLRELHNKDVAYEAKAPQRAIKAAKLAEQKVSDKLDIQLLYSLRI